MTAGTSPSSFVKSNVIAYANKNARQLSPAGVFEIDFEYCLEVRPPPMGIVVMVMMPGDASTQHERKSITRLRRRETWNIVKWWFIDFVL